MLTDAFIRGADEGTYWDDSLKGLRPVFWLETIATFAFATSWMVKGDAMQPLVRGVAALR